MLKAKEIKVIREAFENEAGHSLRLTDDAMSAIVEADRAKFDEMDLEDQVALLLKAEDAFKGISIADASISAIVDKLDAAFFTEVTSCIDAGIKAKNSALDIYGQFKARFTADQMDAWPLPGTEAKDVLGTNFKPDIVEKKAVAGGTIRTVFTDDLVYATPMGKTYQTDIDDATNELKTSGSVARFKSKNKSQLRDIVNTATFGRNQMRKMFRTAIQLHHQLRAVEGMPRVKFSWLPGSSDKCPVLPKKYKGTETFKVSLSGKPIWLETLDPEGNVIPGPANGKEFSVAQLIAFDVRKALLAADGGTVTDLIDSAKGEPETPEQLGEKMSEGDMDTTAVVFAAKLANTQARAALRTRALEPDNDVVRASYCALFVNLRGFYTANEKWYEAFLEKQEKEVTKEKTERAERAA
jgi:hypothetical protein